jgi:hypothetical protein
MQKEVSDSLSRALPVPHLSGVRPGDAADSLSPAPVQILGVNEIGYELGNPAICKGRELPWLQETTASPIWQPWDVTYRDVVILDPDADIALVFNLTTYSLELPGNYAALRDSLLRVAREAKSRQPR